VDNVYNAVYIEDDNLGPSLYYGRGAGDLPTGSAVVADIVSCSRDILSGAVGRVPVGGSRQRLASGHNLQLAEDSVSEFFVRVTAKDRPGVLSTISGLLAKSEISISSVIQRGREPVEGGGVPIVMIIHEASHARLVQALSEIDAMDVTLGKSFYMRILPEGDNQ
jgi:homoserine dehydrogenase